MKSVTATVAYIWRLIVGRTWEWWQLIGIARERSALQGRGDELMLRLGKRYHQYLSESGADPPPAVAETVEDLRAVLGRIKDLEQARRSLRDEAESYIRAQPAWQRVEPPPPAPGKAPAALAVSGPGLEMPEEMPGRRPAPAAPGGGKCECGEAVPAGARFCPACGRPQAEKRQVSSAAGPPRRCPYCGAQLPLLAEFCPECGGHIDAEVYEM